MADYYTPTVVQQVIPFADITPLERLLLGQIFQSDTVEGGLYFTSEDGPKDMIWVESESLSTCLDDPVAKGSAAHAEILHQCGEALTGDADHGADGAEQIDPGYPRRVYRKGRSQRRNQTARLRAAPIQL